MASHQNTSYEPYRAGRHGSDHSAEKPLVLSATGRKSPNGNISRNRQHRAAPNRLRIILRVFILALASTILALQIHSIVVYFNTREDAMQNTQTGWRVGQWPVLDKNPTWVMLGVSAGSFLVQALALITLCSCFHFQDSMWHPIGVYFSSVIFIAAWIGALVYFKIIDSQGANRNHWDIWSYTCYNRAQTGNVPWKALCIEMEYTFVTAIVIAVFEIINLILFTISHKDERSRKAYKKVKTPWK
ncbi:hypothetical protein TWF694_002034 [Orbilia ellipsospora]|uniref:MARVEL domain-containing protein n=1 Tax=Orbilia ellipsospora TaxID=2528407 RepID=A0AAV9X5H8_9PEZI